MPVSFARTRSAPALPPGEAGIRIALEPPPGDGRVVVHGACQLPQDLADALSGTVLENVALVCCAGPGRGAFSSPLVTDEVVFEDDVERAGGWVRAWFSLDLGEGLPRGLRRCFVHASVHTFVSNVVTFERS